MSLLGYIVFILVHPVEVKLQRNVHVVTTNKCSLLGVLAWRETNQRDQTIQMLCDII